MKFSASMPSAPSQEELEIRIKSQKLILEKRELLRKLLIGSYRDGQIVRAHHDIDAPTFAQLYKRDYEEAVTQEITRLRFNPKQTQLAYDIALFWFFSILQL